MVIKPSRSDPASRYVLLAILHRAPRVHGSVHSLGRGVGAAIQEGAGAGAVAGAVVPAIGGEGRVVGQQP